jgi:hypothetical protein
LQTEIVILGIGAVLLIRATVSAIGFIGLWFALVAMRVVRVA